MSGNKIISGLIVFLLLTAFAVVACDQTTAQTTSSPTTSTNLNIVTASLPNGDVGISYSRTLQASGGSGKYSWSILDGSLPPGFSLDARTGSISGTPLIPGSSKFTVQVTDNSGKTASQSLSITINGAAAPLTVRTSSLQDGEIGIKYSQKLEAYGGSSNYTWAVAGGSLPDGLTLDGNSGTISGMPTTTGKIYFSVKVTDSNGTMATDALTLQINPTLSVSTPSLPDGEVGVAYSQTLAAADGVDKYVWSISKGSLPDGLTLDGNSGTISGTPKKSGKSDISVQASDVGGAVVAKPLSININEPITLMTKSLPDGKVGVAYSQTLQFTGGTSNTVWAISSGAVPDGLTFDGNTGAITGTPKTAGTYKFTAEVIDDLGADSSADLAITVN